MMRVSEIIKRMSCSVMFIRNTVLHDYVFETMTYLYDNFCFLLDQILDELSSETMPVVFHQ